MGVDDLPGVSCGPVAVVIPSFRAGATIGEVVRAIGPEVRSIYVVDDFCPDATGERALECADPRLTVLYNPRNLGVGGAVKQGYRRAIADGAGIIVKLDADGQMDPRHIERLIAPIVGGAADYAKGNRFAPEALMPPGTPQGALAAMPPARRLANWLLSLLHRLATGYWRIGDPANGYTAIHAKALERIGTEALADCFFFETDMLHRLNLAGAVVVDVPLPARYPGSGSSLSLRRVAPRFAWLIADRCFQRLRARYFTGQPNLIAVKLAAGVAMIAAATVLALWRLFGAAAAAETAGPPTTIWSLLAVGLLLLGAAFGVDARRQPHRPIGRRDSRG